MNVVSYLNGVSQHLISLDEILPEKASAIAPFISAIMNRYSFRSLADQPGNTNIAALNPVFQNGTFVHDGVTVPVLTLDISAQRITGICSTTDQADAFIDDFLQFIYTTGFRKPKRHIVKFPSSTLIVDFGSGFFRKINVVSEICKILDSRALLVHGRTNFEIQTSRFISPIDTREGPAQLTFVLEERSGRPLGTNWMFTAAPLSTSEHVASLIQIENLVNSTSS